MSTSSRTMPGGLTAGCRYNLVTPFQPDARHVQQIFIVAHKQDFYHLSFTPFLKIGNAGGISRILPPSGGKL